MIENCPRLRDGGRLYFSSHSIGLIVAGDATIRVSRMVRGRDVMENFGVFSTLVTVGDVIAAFGEALAIGLATLAAMGWLVQKKKIPPIALVLWAPVALFGVVVSQEPWGSDEKLIVARQTFDEGVVAVTQFNSGLGDCNTQFWHRNQAGEWRGYLIDNDTARWHSAGFRFVSSNRIDVTRWGLVVGSFDPLTRKFCLLSSGVVFGPFDSSAMIPEIHGLGGRGYVVSYNSRGSGRKDSKALRTGAFIPGKKWFRGLPS